MKIRSPAPDSVESPEILKLSLLLLLALSPETLKSRRKKLKKLKDPDSLILKRRILSVMLNPKALLLEDSEEKNPRKKNLRKKNPRRTNGELLKSPLLLLLPEDSQEILELLLVLLLVVAHPSSAEVLELEPVLPTISLLPVAGERIKEHIECC